MRKVHGQDRMSSVCSRTPTLTTRRSLWLCGTSSSSIVMRSICFVDAVPDLLPRPDWKSPSCRGAYSCSSLSHDGLVNCRIHVQVEDCRRELPRNSAHWRSAAVEGGFHNTFPRPVSFTSRVGQLLRPTRSHGTELGRSNFNACYAMSTSCRAVAFGPVPSCFRLPPLLVEQQTVLIILPLQEAVVRQGTRL